MKTKTYYPSFPLTFEDALYYSDADLLRHLLDKGLSPDSCTAGGAPLFIAALSRKRTALARLLAERGAQTDVCDSCGDSAFFMAPGLLGTWSIEKAWPKADVNAPRSNGDRPLHIAVEAQRPEIILWLLGKEADRTLPNAAGETPLALCRRLIETTSDREALAWLRDCEHALAAPVCHRNEEVLSALLPKLRAEGLEGEAADALFCDALHKGNESAVLRLLEAGLDPNKPLDFNDTRPLALAADGLAPAEVKHRLLRLLVEWGAMPSESDADNWSLLHHAVAFGDTDTLNLMLELGANPYRCDNSGETVLYDAVSGDDASPELISRLLDLGIPVNKGDDYMGRYPLRAAICLRNVELVRELLKRGAHPFIVSQNPRSNMVCEAVANLRSKGPRSQEAKDKEAAIFAMLREKYPFIDAFIPDEKVNALESSLWQAAAFGLAEDVGLCLWLYASPDVCNRAGVSALRIACENGHEQVVYTLLRYGANPNVTPSPLAAAKQLDSPARERITRLLLGFGAKENGEGRSTEPH